jgi:diaminopimelate epimerase
MQGAGNDFIVLKTSDAQRDWSPVARIICDRRFGIGADGLLLALPSRVADSQMRIFNPDGSEAEACGNGLRCLAKYIADTELSAADMQEISIETKSGIRRVRYHYKGQVINKIQTGMGKPIFGADDIPVTIEPGKISTLDITLPLSSNVIVNGKELLLSFVSIGNPHAVFFGQYPVSDFPLHRLGPKIERHKMFPQRVNFEVVKVTSRNSVETRVWERGVGETLACGSGACAVAVVAQLYGYTDDKVSVALPGGILEVEWNRGEEVFLSGPVKTVFTGDWSE